MVYLYGVIHVNRIWTNLLKLQKWAIRTVSNSHYRSHTGPIFAKYNVLTITDMHTLELGTLMYRNSVNELPSSFNNYFTK